MTTLEILNSKIELLKDTIDQLDASKMDEKTRLEAEIVIIEECQNVLNNEELMVNFDFTKAFNLIATHNFSIENLAKIMSDIQVAIDVKRELNLDMPFSENQTTTLRKFIEGLAEIKQRLQKNLEEISKSSDGKKRIKDLEGLKKILDEKGRRKYVTTDMFESFYEVVDWENLSADDAMSLLSGFYNTRNLQGKQNKELVDFEDIIEVYSSFLDAKEFNKNENEKYVGLFASLLQAHEMEVRTFIDLENTREILQFFKDNDILKSFGRNALLKVSLFGKVEYIKTLYEKIKTQHPEELEMYFEDEAATLWVCDKSNYKKKPFRVSRKQGNDDPKTPSLYSQCHSVTDDEFRENVKLLNANSDMFAEKYDITNFGAHLKAKTISEDKLKEFKAILNLVTSSGWAFRKNMGLCRLFGLGTVSKIPMSCLELGDIEDKMHLAIELGLLNPPMNKAYLEMEKDIVRSEEFKKTATKKKLFNQSIRNYFQRYTSYLSKLTINEYAYLTYKLQRFGQVGFYNDFFSDRKAGQRSTEFLTDEERNTTSSKEKIDQFISENFLTEFYTDFVERFDEFDAVITEFTETNMKLQFSGDAYYDPAILDDDLIQKIEREHGVMDMLTQNGELVELPNEFVYLFGDKIISRYKVLHNASILKANYGYLDENMLLTSIVRNSFLNEDEFMVIRDSIKERGKNL